MDIEPIEIDISDNRAYTQVCFLVDRPDFMADVLEVRAKYNILAPFDFSDFDNLYFHFAKILKIDKSLLLELKKQEENADRAREAINFDDETTFDQDLLKSIEASEQIDPMAARADSRVRKKESEFWNDLKSIRRKYGYPVLFNTVVNQSVLYHAVQGYKTASYSFFDTPPLIFEAEKDITAPRDPNMVIKVTPYSTERDIKAAFKAAIKHIKQTKYIDYPAYRVLAKDTVSNIKRDRAWYWRNQKGESLRDIAISENKGKRYFQKAQKALKQSGYLTDEKSDEYVRYLDRIESETELIRKAVKRYKRNLNRHLAIP